MSDFQLHDSDGRFLLDRSQKLPLWRQIARTLEQEIYHERFTPGDRLPSEGKLSVWFGVNRHTVRRAISELRERKLVTVEQGRGTFVSENMVEYQVSRRTRFSENLNRQNHSPSGTLIRSEIREADEEISSALQVSQPHLVAALHILRQGNGRQLSYSTHYFPLPRFVGIAQSFQKTHSVTACLDIHGVHDFFRIETRVAARPPTLEEIRLLDLQKNHPVLETKSLNVDVYGVPVDYGVSRYAGGRVQLVLSTT